MTTNSIIKLVILTSLFFMFNSGLAQIQYIDCENVHGVDSTQAANLILADIIRTDQLNEGKDTIGNNYISINHNIIFEKDTTTFFDLLKAIKGYNDTLNVNNFDKYARLYIEFDVRIISNGQKKEYQTECLDMFGAVISGAKARDIGTSHIELGSNCEYQSPKNIVSRNKLLHDEGHHKGFKPDKNKFAVVYYAECLLDELSGKLDGESINFYFGLSSTAPSSRRNPKWDELFTTIVFSDLLDFRNTVMSSENGIRIIDKNNYKKKALLPRIKYRDSGKSAQHGTACCPL